MKSPVFLSSHYGIKPVKRRDPGFTLIELLTVIAIIVILGAILVPAINGARRSALAGKSRAQFSQWISAIEGFRSEYGYYPFISASGDVEFVLNVSGNRSLFEDVLDGSDTDVNRRGIRFYSITDDELVDPSTEGSLLQDAFGNTQLSILIDGNRDGRIQVGGYDIRGSLEVVAKADDSMGYPRITTWVEHE